MCSNMCARPDLPMSSWVEPVSTCVKKEKTGASGRSQIRTVRPLGRVFTVTRFSKEARSWALVTPAETTRNRKVMPKSGSKRDFMEPPQPLDEMQGGSFEVSRREVRLSNGGCGLECGLVEFSDHSFRNGLPMSEVLRVAPHGGAILLLE